MTTSLNHIDQFLGFFDVCMSVCRVCLVFLCNYAATTGSYTYRHSLSLQDALPIPSRQPKSSAMALPPGLRPANWPTATPPTWRRSSSRWAIVVTAAPRGSRGSGARARATQCRAASRPPPLRQRPVPPKPRHGPSGARTGRAADRQSVVYGKRVLGRVDLGGLFIIKKNNAHGRTNK